jgi:hypothetical protein
MTGVGPASLSEPGPVVRGSAAAEYGAGLLRDATGEDTLEEAVAVALGRPRLGETADTTVWKVKAPRLLDARVRSLAALRGTTRSQVIRDAVAAYMA